MVLNLFFISLALALSAHREVQPLMWLRKTVSLPENKTDVIHGSDQNLTESILCCQLVLSADLTEIYSLQQTPYSDKIYCVAPYPMELDLRKHEKRRKNILGYLDKPMSALQSHSVRFTLPNINIINTKLFNYKRQTTTTTLILGNTSNQLFQTRLLKHV